LQMSCPLYAETYLDWSPTACPDPRSQKSQQRGWIFHHGGLDIRELSSGSGP
jgi:hypothetical protein